MSYSITFAGTMAPAASAASEMTASIHAIRALS
jgi:hypothetical protein